MIEKLETIKDYKDADKKIVACKNKIEEIKKQQEEKRIAEENARIEQERKAEEKRILAEQRKEKRRKKVKKITIMAISALCAIIVLNRGIFLVRSNIKYNEANALLDEKKYIEAFIRFSEISGYKDSAEKAKVIMKDKNIDKMVSIAYDKGRIKSAYADRCGHRRCGDSSAK